MKSKEARNIVLDAYRSFNREKKLVELLEHKAIEVRALAANWIGLENEGFLKDKAPLIAALSDKSKKVRINAVLACGRQKIGEVINIFLSSLENEDLAYDEIIANIKALALLQNPGSEKSLLELSKRFESKGWHSSQKYIADALGWIKLGMEGIKINQLHYY